jgi:hypothetical protein
MESWVAPFEIFLKSPEPETEASQRLHQAFNASSSTTPITTSAFLSLLTSHKTLRRRCHRVLVIFYSKSIQPIFVLIEIFWFIWLVTKFDQQGHVYREFTEYRLGFSLFWLMSARGFAHGTCRGWLGTF